MLTLGAIDDLFTKLNLRSIDGEKPSTLAAVSLATVDSNLHQHG